MCNLGSLCLPKFVVDGMFNYNLLYDVTQTLAESLDRVIDVNYYPVKEANRSNLGHRPIGIGVQGLADVFMMLRIPFDSEEAREVNRKIFETIYAAAVTQSADLARQKGAYETYEGSPASKGILQFDIWGVEPPSKEYWDGVKFVVRKNGLRNSLLVAPMPTASTSQIMGNNECFEPYTSNIYVRRVLSGEFVVVNKFLVNDLIERGLWDEKMKNDLIAANGSVQNIARIPDDLKALYKTVWEISQKAIIDMSADRGAYICQSQSLNIHMADVTFGKLTSMHFYAWKKGLKTGMYYLRTKAAADAIKFTVQVEEAPVCSIDNPDCESCSG